MVVLKWFSYARGFCLLLLSKEVNLPQFTKRLVHPVTKKCHPPSFSSSTTRGNLCPCRFATDWESCADGCLLTFTHIPRSLKTSPQGHFKRQVTPLWASDEPKCWPRHPKFVIHSDFGPILSLEFGKGDPKHFGQLYNA